MDFLTVMPSRNGFGVFAQKKFEGGEVVFTVLGKLITCYLDDDIDDRTRDNTFRFDSERYVSPKGLAEYINHSCQPNTKIIKKNRKLFVVAIQKIPKGEEVVFDYSTILARDDTWTMKCNCGSDMCRGVVKRFCLLPKALKERYVKGRIVPSYIVEL